MNAKSPFPRAFFLMLALVASVPLVFAHSGAMGPTKERMDAMGETKAHLKSLRAATTGNEVDAAAAQKALDELNAFAEELPALFDERHLPDVSEARAKIWDQPEQFEDEIRFFSQKLEEARAQLDEDPAQVLRTVAAGCGSCHDDFRRNKKSE
ncbi:c-type cytochrome [Maritalea mediterranea]|uniref:Cytochrome c n=1 Tax=Maritalea mediterranea TaxID=2909667 RepID=A0ABS9E4Z3_9HYPH|nr:cytochrome c [Maritalea mediterranea]MCF4097329.1 cytochrome c [Maritalea mediterranea]